MAKQFFQNFDGLPYPTWLHDERIRHGGEPHYFFVTTECEATQVARNIHLHPTSASLISFFEGRSP
ncbi:MAG: hypothetical protein IPM82_11830 [Saprospiraceae bacterium]|nr:hypothetical protein [Saprospiraceae bacterium]